MSYFVGSYFLGSRRFIGVAGFVLFLFALAPAWASKDAVPDWVKAAMAQPSGNLPAESSAVVLLDETTINVGPDGKAVEHRRRVVKILRPNGRDEGIVGVPFDDDSKVLSLKVWSVGPDGHEYAVKDNEIAEVGAAPEGNYLYSDERIKVARPPGRDPGCVIAYEYEQRRPPYKHEATWFFQDDIPHLKQSYTLELPPGYTYQVVWAHHEQARASDLEHQRYRWDLETTPAIDLDKIPLAPDLYGLAGRMTVHYGPPTQSGPALGTWPAIGDFYDQLARSRMASNPEIAAKATELAAGKTDFYDITEGDHGVRPEEDPLLRYREGDWWRSASCSFGHLPEALRRLQG